MKHVFNIWHLQACAWNHWLVFYCRRETDSDVGHVPSSQWRHRKTVTIVVVVCCHVLYACLSKHTTSVVQCIIRLHTCMARCADFIAHNLLLPDRPFQFVRRAPDAATWCLLVVATSLCQLLVGCWFNNEVALPMVGPSRPWIALLARPVATHPMSAGSLYWARCPAVVSPCYRHHNRIINR